MLIIAWIAWRAYQGSRLELVAQHSFGPTLIMSSKAEQAQGAATENTEEPQLAELVNQEAGLSSEIELKVIRHEILDYTYNWQGRQVPTQKLQVLLQSKLPDQYCLGVAKLVKGDKSDLMRVADRWQCGTTWRFKGITLLNDKPAYIHTPCRIAIDLRKSKAQALLQSTSFPQAPVPNVTIADVLHLKQMQRFDLMAVPATILEGRKASAGMHIADVRLVDGSKQTDSTTTEYASLPLTLFFKDARELTLFKGAVDEKKPLLFMCLAGNSQDGRVQVNTIKTNHGGRKPQAPSVSPWQRKQRGCVAKMLITRMLPRCVRALQCGGLHQPHGHAHGVPAGGSNMRTPRLSRGRCYRAPLPTESCVRGAAKQGRQHQDHG